MPFNYTTVAWAALNESQKITAVFAQLDDNLVFVGNATKAEAFLEAVQYLRYHRPQQSGSNNRSLNYADYADDVAMASKVVEAGSTSVNRSTFTRMAGLT